MARYRKKPVVIEAYQVPTTWPPVRYEPFPGWLIDAADSIKQADDDPRAMLITTLEGVMRADPGDWIIRGIKGELYPCKPDIFAATYEPVVEVSGPSA